MNVTGNDPACGDSGITSRERFHAWFAYHRPRGNTDPDSDPAGEFAPFVFENALSPVRVSCWSSG